MPSVKKLLLVAGARPNFMKIAPVIREIANRRDQFTSVLVHTGQHYDEGMSDVFFRDLGIPAPDYYLNVGSASHAQQTAKIMVAFEPVLQSEKPDCVLVFGDVNSTLACSIVAKKLEHKVAHVEAGLRSGDMRMPEEINRIVTDSISDYFFVTEESGIEHLMREGKSESVVFHVGHVMIDNLYYELEKLKESVDEGDGACGMADGLRDFAVLTLHRPSNVDDEKTLRGILGAVSDISSSIPVIFPMHPRTKACLDRFAISLPDTVRTTSPLGYLDFLKIWTRARFILTDSGGLQEETTALGIPCLTLRENTERPVTLTDGTNQLVGVNPDAIRNAAACLLELKSLPRSARRPALWDGRASARILDVLSDNLR